MKYPITVLVVDDEQTIRQLCARILEGAGYQVRLASDGLDALQVLESGMEVDCIVVDLMMPKMSGLTLAMKLHEARPNLPAVIISGKVDVEADSIKGLAAMSGTTCLLRKPFDPEQLVGAVKRALAGECHELQEEQPGRKS